IKCNCKRHVIKPHICRKICGKN
nr:mast cell degranulating peptide [Apis mellifera]